MWFFLPIVVTLRRLDAGTKPQTGESYAAARREVIREFRAARSTDRAVEPEWFAISYDDTARRSQPP